MNDRFCGKLVNAGDDRCQTNLLMKRGYMSRQSPFAIAITETPDRLPRYLIQQLRWSRSTIRNITFQISAIGKHHPYLIMVTLYELLFPFLVIFSFLPTFNIITQGNHVLFHRILTAVGVLAFRTLLLTCFNNWDIKSSIYNMFVFPMYFVCLLPIKMYAWSTPWVQGWLTSSRKTIFTIVNWDVILVYISVIIWDIILILCMYFRFSSHDSLLKPLHNIFS
jgi:cellulose synthase/poly-beta-1,6-N-acetylglucosamine synthase-like glycosyltransferase